MATSNTQIDYSLIEYETYQDYRHTDTGKTANRVKTKLNPSDPMLVLSYLLLLVSAAVIVTSGQFPWFVFTLIVGLVMSLLFPIRKVGSKTMKKYF